MTMFNVSIWSEAHSRNKANPLLKKLIEKYRLPPHAFIRNRTLSFPIIVLFLANLVKGSPKDEIDQFF